MDSETARFTTAPKLPDNLQTERRNRDLSISWTPSPQAAAYALQIDGCEYGGLTECAYLLEDGAEAPHEIRVRACGETDSLWSAAYQYSGMLCDFEESDGLDGWTPRMSGSSDVRLETVDGRGCMALIDHDFSTSNEYLSTASVQKQTADCYGKVVFKTQFLYKKYNHSTNNLEITISGTDLQNMEKTAIKMYVFSDGAFGYTIAEGTPFQFLPGKNPMVTVKENTWVQVTVVMDTNRQAIDLIVQSDMYKGYLGMPLGDYDPETGTCRINGMPFYSQDTSAQKKPNEIVALNKIYIGSSRYTGEYYFDNVDMYMETDQDDLCVRQLAGNKTSETAALFTGCVENLSGKAHTVVFAIGEYTGAGRLVQVQIGKHPVGAYETLWLKQGITAVNPGSALKAFVWDEDMRPAGKAVTHNDN